MSSHPESGPCKTCKCNDIIIKEYKDKNKDMVYCRIVEKYIENNNCYGENCRRMIKDKNSGYCNYND